KSAPPAHPRRRSRRRGLPGDARHPPPPEGRLGGDRPPGAALCGIDLGRAALAASPRTRRMGSAVRAPGARRPVPPPGPGRPRAPRPSPPVWSVTAAFPLILSPLQIFQPFRNLLPLVAPPCILVAILWDRLRGRLTRPVWADAAAALLLAAVFARPVAGYVWE